METTKTDIKDKYSFIDNAKSQLRKFGTTRLIIVGFLLLLVLIAGVKGLNLSMLFSNVLVRVGFNSILVLSMLPGIRCGIDLNLGMPLGIVGGLLSTLIALEYGMTGWPAFVFSVVLGALIATFIGYVYGMLLNKLKGQEMTVSFYISASFIALMCIFWGVAPFKNPSLTWALGSGLRLTHNMSSSFGKLLNNFLAFKIFGITVPTGLFLFFGLCAFGVKLFFNSKTGIAMSAGGANPRFAEATGINVNHTRLIGTILSTVFAAVGIVVYSQGYGFMQLYNAPKSMGVVAASAILLGGASLKKASITNVLLGCFFLQGILAFGMPVANALVPDGSISEVLRILISNGIILYALSKSGGDSRE